MLHWIRALIGDIVKNWRQFAHYVFWGAITAFLNLCLFFALANWCGWNYAVANVAAWVVYVVAAYFSNRWFVFRQRGGGARAVWRGLRDFASCRLGTCVLETAIMALLVSGLGLPQNPVKIGASALSATINYIVSRFWIFGKVKKEAKKYTGRG